MEKTTPTTDHPEQLWRHKRHVLIVMLAALIPALVGNAESLHIAAQNQKQGIARKILIQFTERALTIQRALGITWLRSKLSVATHQEVHDDFGALPPPRIHDYHQEITTSFVHPTPSPSTVTGSNRQTPQLQQPFLRRGTPQQPLRIWIGGDSMARAFGPAFVNHTLHAPDIVAATMFRQSTGLVRPWMFDWPARIDRSVREQQPDAVILVFGANDDHDIVLGDRTLAFATDQWQVEYRRRVGSLMDQLRGRTAVIWMGLPPMRVTAFARSMQIINSIYREQAAIRPWVRFYDPQPLFADEQGNYTAYLRDHRQRMVLMRASDGVHYTYEGGERLADGVIQFIRTLSNEAGN